MDGLNKIHISGATALRALGVLGGSVFSRGSGKCKRVAGFQAYALG